MSIHNKINVNNLSRNIHGVQKRVSYHNIFGIKNIISNFQNKYNLDFSKVNTKIKHYTQKNKNLYCINKINNSINHLLLKNQNLNLNYFDKCHIFSFKRKRACSSYFDKVRNLYALKTPTIFSEKIANIHKKINTNKNLNKNKINKNLFLPKIKNKKINIISNFNNKSLNKDFSKNSKSSSIIRNNILMKKIKLPRIKSTIIYNNKNIYRNAIFIKNKNLKRCKSSKQIPFGVKSIYMSLDLNAKRKNNHFIKGFLLKNYSHKNSNFIHEKSYNNESNIKNSQKYRIKYNIINNFHKINIDKNIKREKGKEYDFSQSFKQVNNLNLDLINDNDNMLLNDKGTLIGPFIK